MTIDSSTIGISARLVASQTYPNGITLTAFPEDGDLGITGNLGYVNVNKFKNLNNLLTFLSKFLGNDPTTSASPPVLINGTHSEAANNTFFIYNPPYWFLLFYPITL